MIDDTIKVLEHEAVKLQLDDHFLKNTLNYVQSAMLLNKVHDANILFQHLSKVMDISLQMSRGRSISIATEVDYLNAYLHICKSRLNNSFNFTIKVDPSIDITNTYVPFLLIQPIVNDTIEKRLKVSENFGFLSIEIYAHNTNIYVSVYDNSIFISEDNNQNANVSTPYLEALINNLHSRIEVYNKRNPNSLQLNTFSCSETRVESLGEKQILTIQNNLISIQNLT